MNKHIPVLLDEVVTSLNLKEDSIVVDATLGYAGHSSNILKKIKRGHLFAFDQDSEAIRQSTDRLNSVGTNFTIYHSNFRYLKKKLNEDNIYKVNGFLFDLGVSSPELDEDSRGFSYHKEAKLDMRMNKDQKLSAYEVVNDYSEEKLREIFYKYGEDKYSRSIAKNICKNFNDDEKLIYEHLIEEDEENNIILQHFKELLTHQNINELINQIKSTIKEAEERIEEEENEDDDEDNKGKNSIKEENEENEDEEEEEEEDGEGEEDEEGEEEDDDNKDSENKSKNNSSSNKDNFILKDANKDRAVNILNNNYRKINNFSNFSNLVNNNNNNQENGNNNDKDKDEKKDNNDNNQNLGLGFVVVKQKKPIKEEDDTLKYF